MADGSIIIDTKVDSSGIEKGLGELASKAGSVIGSTFKVIASGITAATGAIAGLAKVAVDQYATYEQMVGGVETLFKDSAGIVENYAANAYKTAGLSANEYMNTITSFSASLLQGLGGDTKKAAEVGNQAVIDMSDNANKMGTDMQSIQNAYQGFAKQNYTMLDNLKLGYGGTKSEMERLLADAEKLTGVHYDISNFSDIIEAIHAVQENLGITGTTAKEASTTIEGSMNMTKAAWKNMLTGMADDDADFDTLVDNLVDSVGHLAENLLPRIGIAINGVGKLISELLPVVVNKIPDVINTVLPSLLDTGKNLISTLVTGIQENVSSISSGALEIITTLIEAILEVLPQLLEVGGTIAINLINGLAEKLPELIPKIVDSITNLAAMVLNNADTFVQVGSELVAKLLEGMQNAIPGLSAILDPIKDMFSFISDNANEVTTALLGIGTGLAIFKGASLILAFVEALKSGTLAIKAMAVAQGILNAVMAINPFVLIASAIAALAAGIIYLWNTNEGFRDAIISAWESIGNACSEVWTSVCNFFTETIPNAFNSCINAVVNFASSIGSTISNIASTISTAISNAVTIGINFLYTTIVNTFNSIQDYLDSTYPGLLDGLSEIWEGVSEAFQAIFEEIEVVVSDSISIIVDLFTGNFEGLKNDLLDLFSSFSEVFEEVGEGISLVLGGISEAVTSIVYEAANEIGQLVGSIATGAVSIYETVSETIDSIVEWFEELPDRIAESLSNAIQIIYEWGTEVYDTVSQTISETITAVGEWFSQLPGVIADGLNSAIDAVVNWGSSMLSSAESAASNTITAIGNWFSQLPSNIANGLSSAISAIASWGSSALSTAISAAQSIVSGIYDTLSQLPSKVVSIGSNIVAGIKNGISSAWNGMVGWLGGLCDSFISGVKAKFDIHSPSRVMRDQIGKFIPLGIVEGIKATTGDLIASATNMAQAVINAVQEPFKNKNLAESMVAQFRSASGTYEKLANELNSSQENYDWWSKRKVDDNEWYASAKSNLDAIKEKIKELKDAKTKDNKDSIEAQIKAWEQTQKEAEKEVEYCKKAAQEEIDANKQKYKIELNTAKEHKKQLETLIKGLTDAIKEQLNQQKEAAVSAIDDELSALENRYNRESDRIDETSEKRKNRIQSEIDKLDEEKEAEDRLKEVQEANNNIAVLQAKMNNTASEADKKAYALKIKNAKAALEAKKAEWDRTDEKARLKEEQDEIEERAKRKKERLKADYEEEKEALEKKKKATEEYYKTLLETDNLNAQVRYRMLNDSNEQLVQLLNSYAPYWQDAGQSLADSLINGLNSKREDMAHAVASMTELRGSLSGYASGTSYNRLSGLYNVDEKGFEISTGNNPVAYVSRGAGILNHMQSLQAIDKAVKSRVSEQMQALKNLVLGQQQQMYQLAGAMAGVVNNSSSIREGDINFNVEHYHNDRKDSIKETAEELGFYAKRKKRR